MPGITGIIGPGNNEALISSLNIMSEALTHESFYGIEKYLNQPLNIYLAWTYFKDEPGFSLPIWNRSKDVFLVFSGQLFSIGDEKPLLNENKDYGEPSFSYLIQLYEEIEAKVFEILNGQFAGYLLDLRKGISYLFNDRFGFGRIYYRLHDGKLFFSTEAKSLLRIFPDCREFDNQNLAEYLACGCVLGHKSIFRKINILPPAGIWKIKGNVAETEIRTYQPGQDEKVYGIINAEEYYQKLRNTLIRILPRYIPEDKHVGVSVTGGKDTRIILSLADLSRTQITAYTFGSIYRENRDEKIGKIVARLLDLPFITIKVGQEFLKNFPALAEKTVYLTDGVMDVSGSPDLYTNRVAREISPIRLTGNYGQEIIEGSIAFRPSSVCERFLNEDLKFLLGKAKEKYFEEIKQLDVFSFIIKKQFPWHHYNRYKLESSQLYIFSPFLDNDIVALASQIIMNNNPALKTIRLKLYAEANAQLAKIETDRGYKLVQRSLYDKLNVFYQEFTFKAEYAYDYGMPPLLSLLDFIFKPFHPERLFLGRHKFYHFRVWYRDQLKEYVKEVLLDKSTLRRPYLNPNEVIKIVKGHTSGIRNHTVEIHKLLTLELINRSLLGLK